VYHDVIGALVNIPTIGNNTGRDYCDLGVGNSSSAVEDLQFELNDCYGQHLTRTSPQLKAARPCRSQQPHRRQPPRWQTPSRARQLAKTARGHPLVFQ
jgi:hypothetical protein